MKCQWLSRDETGRPSCEHGPAISDGPSWSCRRKAAERVARYRLTEKGTRIKENWNRSEPGRSSKALYELTRVR